MNQAHRRARRAGCVALCLLLLIGAGESSAARKEANGTLVVFLRPIHGPDPPVVLEFARIEAVAANDETVVLRQGPFELSSAFGGGEEAELLKAPVRRAAYRALRLVPVDAPPIGERGEEEGPSAIEIPVPFKISRDTTTTLFLTWSPSSRGPQLFTPRVEQPQLRSLLIFVANRDSHDLTVIQRSRSEVVGTVQVGKQPTGLAADPSGLRVYVANSGSDSVSVVDTVTRRVLDTLRLEFGSRPTDIAVSPDGRRLYVTAANSAELLTFDAASLQQIGRTEVGLHPSRVEISRSGSLAYVANRQSNTISAVDARTLRIAATIPVEARPWELAIDPRTERLLVAHESSDGVAVLAPNLSVERVLHFGAPIAGLAVDDEGRRLYLAAGAMDRLLFGRVGSESITGFVTLPAPGRLRLDPEGKEIYVLDREADRLRIVNRLVARQEGSIPTGDYPTDLVLLSGR